MRPDDELMRIAISLATENVRTGAGGPFGAVIVRDGEVVAMGVNRVTSSNDPTAHAEICAIRSACLVLGRFDLSGCTIYSSCEPCPMCLTAILWARCEALYFASTAEDAAQAGFDDSHFYEQVARRFDARELPTKNLLREAGLESFELWRQSAEKVAY